MKFSLFSPLIALNLACSSVLFAADVDLPIPVETVDSALRVSAELWASPRHGETVVRFEAVNQAVQRLLAQPQSHLLIRHPEGEMGELLGQELQAWLVSLGLVSTRIELLASVDSDDSVELVVVDSMLEMRSETDSPELESMKLEPNRLEQSEEQ